MNGAAEKEEYISHPSVKLGACRAANMNNIADVLAVAEGESFRRKIPTLFFIRRHKVQKLW
jgi:hypothetical protein